MARGKIEIKMVEYLNRKLQGNGLYEEALARKDARTVFRLAAMVCVGIREVGGNNKGPMVELIQETIGGADKEPWCMSFVQTCLAFAELMTEKKSPVAQGEHCLNCWDETPAIQRVKMLPLAGAIVIWRHGTSRSGHTGIVDSADNTHFWGFEGNTESGIKPGGKVERDGGGVYHTNRSYNTIGDMRLMGFLKPF